MDQTSEGIEAPLVVAATAPSSASMAHQPPQTDNIQHFQPQLPPQLSSSPHLQPPITTPSKSKSSSSKSGKKKANPKLNAINLLNLLGYLTSLITSYLGGVAGWFGGMSNAELSLKYQTLITPSATYFGYIWAIIFLFEGFFAVSQLLPQFRNHILVTEGIGYVFFLACVAQTTWTVTFGYELMMAAFLAMMALFLFLLTLLRRQWTIVADEMEKIQTMIATGEIDTEEDVTEDFTARPPRLSYWLLRFGFGVHAGWIAPATPLMLCVLFVQLGMEPNYELWVGVISLPLLFGCCMGLLLREEPGAPSYVFPGVVAYACAGISWELYAPSNAILTRHDEASISLMKNLTGFCAACLMVVIVSRCIALFLRDQCMKRKNKGETVEIDGVEYPYLKV